MHVKNMTEGIRIVRAEQRRRDIARIRENTAAMLLGTLALYVIAFKLRKK